MRSGSYLCALVFLSSGWFSIGSGQPLAPATVPDSTPLPESLPASIEQVSSQILKNQASLDQTRHELRELEQRLGELSIKEQAGLAKVASYEEKIALTRRLVRQLREQARARTREVAHVARDIQQTGADISARKQALGRRLTSMYKYGRLFPVEALLSTKSLPEVYRKMIHLRWIARADQRLAADLEALKHRLAGQQARLVASRAELERLGQEQTVQERALESERAAEATLLARTRAEKQSGEGLKRELAERAAQLVRLLTELEQERARTSTDGRARSLFEASKGKLPWPLRGKVIAWFGSQIHPRYKTKTNNLGIAIKAKPGSRVQAVAPGRVAYADQFMGYGNLVILDHGAGFYTLYANLDEMSVAVGTEARSGGQVGVAGDYLHFEVRKDGKPVNPIDWLKP